MRRFFLAGALAFAPFAVWANTKATVVAPIASPIHPLVVGSVATPGHPLLPMLDAPLARLAAREPLGA
ncbi:MAG: hypothetical protein HY553_10335, partial [Elusimicrobia bacterium]|nr:hypothetical protein [Elusimicrobiota bacterium]